MGQTRLQGRLAGFLGILICSAILPACKAPDGNRYSPFAQPPPDSTNTVLRPPFPWPNTKLLYLSGYAGANYDSTTCARPIYINAAPPTTPPTAPSTITVEPGTWESN